MKTLIQISDCHIDATLPAHTQNLSAVVQTIAKIPADVLLLSGDLSQHGTPNSYQLLQKILAPLIKKPKNNSNRTPNLLPNLLLIAGNHDNLAHLTQQFSPSEIQQHSAQNSAPQQKLTQTAALGNWEIITTHSARANHVSGYLTKNTLAQLKYHLQNTTAKHNIIAMHHPPVPMLSDWDDALSLTNAQDFFNLIADYPKIKGVIWGHAHQAGEFTRGNLRLIACPSTAHQFNDEPRIGFNQYQLFSSGDFTCQTHWITPQTAEKITQPLKSFGVNR